MNLKEEKEPSKSNPINPKEDFPTPPPKDSEENPQ